MLKKQKRILVTGVFSTGKTKTCEDLSTELNKLQLTNEILTDIGRECPLPLNKSQTFISSSWLFLAQISNESKYMFSKSVSKSDYLICDRSLPDILSHTEFLEPQNQMEILLFDKMKELAFDRLMSFDYIFFSKISNTFPITSDGVREIDKKYQHSLQKLHHNILSKSGCKFHELPESIKDRLSFILKTIIN